MDRARGLLVGGGLLAVAYAVYRRVATLRAALADATKRRNRLALELMSARNSRMHSAESIRIGRSFTPRPSDVFVVTYPKCGTVGDQRPNL